MKMVEKKIMDIKEIEANPIVNAYCLYGSEASDNGEFERYFDQKKIDKALKALKKIMGVIPSSPLLKSKGIPRIFI
jgi:hypothetical protein